MVGECGRAVPVWTECLAGAARLDYVERRLGKVGRGPELLILRGAAPPKQTEAELLLLAVISVVILAAIVLVVRSAGEHQQQRERRLARDYDLRRSHGR